MGLFNLLVRRWALRLCLYAVSVILLSATTRDAGAQASYTGNPNFSTVSIGNTSAPQTLTFSFSSPASLNTKSPVQVLTTGVTGLDFKNAGTGSCGSGTYSSCTVDVTFAPSTPGLRLGAVVIEDSAGNVLSTAYLQGVGQGPQIAFDVLSTQSTIGPSTGIPEGVAVDAAGNVYIADNKNNAVYKVAPGGTQTTVTSSISKPDGIAVDGAGNIYVVSSTGVNVTKITPAGAQSTLGSGLSSPAGMALDGAGNLYIACISSNSIAKITPSGTQTTLGSGLNTPDGVAVDAAGNLYVADTSNNRIVKIAPDSTQTVAATVSFPEGVAVDAAGNIYAAQYANQITEFNTAGTQLRTLGSSLKTPISLAFDGLGNIYVAQGSAVLKINRSSPTIGFLSSSVGTKSADSPKNLTVENIGNAALSLTVPSSGMNPTLTDSADFSFDSSTTCALLTASSTAAATVASGTSCVYALNLVPTTTGTITGTLVVTDNTLNTSGATQSLTLNNQGTPTPATVTVTTVSTSYTGSPIPVPVTTNPAGLSVSITYTPFSGGASTTVDPTGPGNFIVTATVTTPGYSGTGTGYLLISRATPTITWATPPPITIGTPLSSTQLNATANVAGTFAYSIPAGTLLAVGSYSITATFTPTDTTDYNTAAATVTLVVQDNVKSVAPVDFGTVQTGTPSATQTVTFNFLKPVTLNASMPVQVVTQGITGLDFQSAGGGAGACAAGSYAASSSCTVTVAFTPAAAGARYGAVVLEDTAGNAAATAYLRGVGQGPQVAYNPGVSSTFASGTASEGVTTDASGNVYINTGSAVIKVAADGTQTHIVGSISPNTSLPSEGGIAVDGAGNIYVADTFDNRILEFTPAGASYTVGIGFNTPYSVAVDASRNLYVTDTKNGQIVKISSDGTRTVFAMGLVYPEGVSVDSAGNVYVADNATPSGVNQTPAGAIYKYTPSGAKSTAASGLLNPSGTAVDAAGNIYFVGADHTTVQKIAPNGVQSTFLTGLNFPFGVAVDSVGNLYVAHATASAEVLKVNRSTAPGVAFASTAVGSTSTDSPRTVTFENIGNSDLHLAAGGTTVSANFSLDNPTCPVPTTTQGILASGSSCTYPIDFKPTVPGPITGSLSVRDDAPGTTQTIALSGTATGTTAATVTLSNLNQTYTGSPISVTVTTNPAGLAVSVTYNGSTTPPTAAGSYSVVATITDPNYSGSTTGTLVITGVPAAKLAPAQITFSQSVGSAAPSAQMATLTNSGTDTLLIGSIAISGTNASLFTQTSACGTSLAVGQSCAITVGFNGSTAGNYAATLTVTDNASPAMQSVALSAVVNGTPVASLTPTSLSFTATAGTTSAVQTAMLQNTGTADLSISSIQLNGTNAASFAQTNTCGPTLAPNASCVISVTFAPVSAGSYSASLIVTDNSGGNTTVASARPNADPSAQVTQTVTLTGTATAAPAPAATLTPPSYGFGNVNAGTTSSSASFTLTNTGNVDLTITSVTLTGANVANFAIANNGCGTALAVSKSCVVSITFTPNAATGFAGTLTITDSAGTQSSTLTGTGIATVAPDFSITASPSSQATYYGASVSYTISLASLSPANPFTSAVALTARGLPVGATAAFAPATLVPGTSTATSIMTVTVPAITGALRPMGLTRWPLGISLATFVTVFGLRRRRTPSRLLALLFLIGLGTAATVLTGCGSDAGFATPTSTSSIIITGTSGTSVHTTTVTLTLK